MASNLLVALATVLLIAAAVVAYAVGQGFSATLLPSFPARGVAGLIVGIFVFAQVAYFAAVGFVLVSMNDKLNALTKARTAADEKTALPKENHRYRVTDLQLGLEAEPTGLLVYELDQDSQAVAAGLQRGDLITHVNGVTLSYLPTTEHQIRALKGTAPKRIDGQRSGEPFNLTLA